MHTCRQIVEILMKQMAEEGIESFIVKMRLETFHGTQARETNV